MPYYIGDVIEESKRLVIRTPEEFNKTGIDARVRTHVEGIDAQKGLVYLSGGMSIPYDYLVMATGAKAVRLDIPGQDLEGVFSLKNLSDAIRIKSWIRDKHCRRAVILGAGYIAMEMCEALQTIGLDTKIVYRGKLPAKKWDPAFSQVILDEIKGHGVEFVSGKKPLAIEKGKTGSLQLVTDSGVVEADIILMALGVSPEVSLAKSIGLSIGEGTGAVQVDLTQKTSRENVWAVGDCCEVFHKVAGRWVYLPLGDIANKQGRVAGQNIGGSPMEFPGIVGAQAFKVFNLEVAATGLTEEEAAQSGFDPVGVLIWGVPVARSMAKGEKLGIKLVGDKKTRKLLGGQLIGKRGAVQRVYALSVALWSGLTVDEVGYLDFPYTPPFGGAWDAIHIAAQDLARKLT